MDKSKIFLVRHTETIGNIEKRLTGHEDYPLTKKGEIYVQLLTEKLKSVKFDVIYSSTSKRARKTIEPLAKLNNIKICENKNLCEMYFGIYDGYKWEDVNKENPQIRKRQINLNEISGIPKQETMKETADRMYTCIEKIVKENLGKTILIASHGIAIEAFLRKISGVAFTYEREKYCQHNTAINELEYDNNKFKILKIGDITHIDGIKIEDNIL